MEKIALFLADGFEEIEALGTLDILRRAGLQAVTVSINDNNRATGAHGVEVITDYTFDAADLSKIEMAILPGGMPGAQHLKEHEGLRKLLLDMNSANKNIAAICAAPMVLGSIGILENRKATCYPGFESELTGAKVTGKKVVVDDNIITGKGPGLMFDFALEIVEKLAGKSIRKEVEEGLLL